MLVFFARLAGLPVLVAVFAFVFAGLALVLALEAGLVAVAFLAVEAFLAAGFFAGVLGLAVLVAESALARGFGFELLDTRSLFAALDLAEAAFLVLETGDFLVADFLGSVEEAVALLEDEAAVSTGD